MGTDQNVDPSLLEILQDLSLPVFRDVAVQQFHPDRKIIKTLFEGIKMLEGKHRCRAQVSDLLIVIDCFESSPNGHFCLAEADITAQKTVHRLGIFHILFAGIGVFFYAFHRIIFFAHLMEID